MKSLKELKVMQQDKIYSTHSSALLKPTFPTMKLDHRQFGCSFRCVMLVVTSSCHTLEKQNMTLTRWTGRSSAHFGVISGCVSAPLYLQTQKKTPTHRLPCTLPKTHTPHHNNYHGHVSFNLYSVLINVLLSASYSFVHICSSTPS